MPHSKFEWGIFSIMATTANDIYMFTLKLIRKNQSASLDSVEWAYHWNDAQATFQDDLVGRFQRNAVTKEGINTGLIENEEIMSMLSPFIKLEVLTVVSGSAPKPPDFRYALALRVNDYKVFKITHDQKWSVSKNVISPPSSAKNNYYFIEYNGAYTFLPSDVTSAELDYVSVPVPVVWGFTLDGNNRKVYNPGSSVNPQWGDNACKEITKRMLTNLGVSFKDADFINFGTKVQQTGE